MKLGNVSQTIVEVPKFFFDKTKDIDAFKSQYHYTKTMNTSKNNYSFSKIRNLLDCNLDINFNNNPRIISKLGGMNKEIYLPIYKRYFTPNYQKKKELPDENKNTKYSTRYKIIKKFLNYKKKMNINEMAGPKLREEIMNNTYNLIEKIKSDYDLTLYSNFDSRSTLNQNLNTRYSSFSETIKHKKTEKELFRKVLSNKINSLRTINPKVKEILKKINHKQNMYIKKEEDKKNPEKIRLRINNILKNTTSNLLRLQYNNKENYGYDKKDQYFIDTHKALTTRINNNKKSNLYNEFPSKTRMEFAISRKKILIPKKIINEKDFILRKEENEINTCRNEEFNKYLKNDMWSRPLHEDAFKLDDQ